METSLRYAGDSKSLRIHAKQSFPIASNTFCQLHGELDTRIGTTSFLSAVIRHFFYDLSASVGVGCLFDRKQKPYYHLRGKKSFPLTSDGMLSFNVKGYGNADEEFRMITSSGAAELALCIFNVKKDQDLRIKIGCGTNDKIPYVQVRENNWTLNVDGNGKWNVRYDL